MHWPTITLLFLFGGIALHLWWRSRYKQQTEVNEWLRRDRDQLKKERDEIRNEVDTQQNALFDSMVEGVLLLDEKGFIKHANQAILTLFNLEAERVIGRTIMESLRLHELEAMLNFLEHKNQIMGTEVKVPGQEDSQLEINAVSIKDTDGVHSGFIMVFHDLTRIRKLENTRREFVANASHELRTPLSMIKGYVETLLDGAKDDPKAIKRFLPTIAKHTDRLTLVVEDLLSLSRLESEGDTLELSDVNLSDIFAGVSDELAPKATNRDIDIYNQIDTTLTLQADEPRLRQVFFNLLENAVKYSGEGKQVTVSGHQGKEGFLEICVADNGNGIPQHALDRIFERFYRVDKSRSRESGDTGLGLAIVKHIVQLHGGTVWCESTVGEGAKFYFTLKLNLQPAGQASSGN
jgi:two-component system phosphate regulon sensor histidine kinase PhoR